MSLLTEFRGPLHRRDFVGRMACRCRPRRGASGGAVAALALLATSASSAYPQHQYRPLIDGVFSAWRHADVVCLGEGHGSARDSRFRIALVRDPRFAETVDIVIVEFVNPVHQDLLDRFVLDGEDMTRDEIGVVWRDATSPQTWESRVYEEFLRTMQNVNRQLPKGDRVRVVGADSPIAWSAMATAEQLVAYINRGKNIREAIAREALDPALKTLAVFGAGHCVKIGMGFPGELAEAYPGRFWSVSGLYGDAGDTRGRATFGLSDTAEYVRIRGTQWDELAAAGLLAVLPHDRTTIGEMVDAILWFGAESDSVVPAPGDWPDADATRELNRRGRLSRRAAELLFGARGNR